MAQEVVIKAIVQHRYGSPDVLAQGSVRSPPPAQSEAAVSHCDGDTRSSRVQVARRQQRRDIRRRRGCRVGTRAANDRRTVGTTHVVVEVDGDRFHSTRFRRRLDARKQALLEAAGYRVLRLSWERVTADYAQTALRIRRALGAP